MGSIFKKNKFSKVEVIQSWKLAAASACYCLELKKPHSAWVDYVELFCLFLYELSFPLSLSVGDEGRPDQSGIFPILYFAQLRSLGAEGYTGLGKRMVAYVVSALMLFNGCFLLCLIRYYRSKRSSTRPSNGLFKLANFHLQLSTSLLFVPYITIVLLAITCSSNDPQGCISNPITQGEVIYFYICISLHAAISFSSKVTVFDWNPLSNLPLALAHSHVKCFMFSGRFFITVMFGTLHKGYSPNVESGLALACIMVSLIAASLIVFYLPYFHLATNQLWTCIYTTSFMASLTILIGMQAGAGKKGDIILISIFILGTLLFIPTILFLIKWRYSLILKIPLNSLSTATDIELRLRFEFQRAVKSTIRDRNSEKKNGSLTVQETKQFATMDELVYRYAKRSHSSFRIAGICASYMFYNRNNKFLAIQTLQEVLSQSPFIFDVLPAEMRIRYFAEYANEEELNSGLMTYEEQSRLERLASKCMFYSLFCQGQFWATLMSNDYNLEKMEDLAEDISCFSETAEECLKRVVALNPKSPFFRSLYGFFLGNIINDEGSAKRQMIRAMELEHEEDSGSKLTESRNCIVVISGEKHRMGHILEVSSMTTEVFGLSSEDLVGNNVTILMASPFAHNHDARLVRYIEEKAHNLLSFNRRGIVIRKKDGTILESDLQVREYANFTLRPSISFFGVLTPHKERNICLIRNKDKVITDISSTFASTFSPNMQKYKNKELCLGDLIPKLLSHFEQALNILQNEAKYTISYTHLDKEGITASFRVQFSNLICYKNEYCHVLFEPEIHFELPKNVSSTEMKTAFVEKGEKEKRSLKQKLVKIKSLSTHLRQAEPSKSSIHMLMSTSISMSMRSDILDNGEQEGGGSISSSTKSSQWVRGGLYQSIQKLNSSLRNLILWVISLMAILLILGISIQEFWSVLFMSHYYSSKSLLSIPMNMGVTSTKYSADKFNLLTLGVLYSNDNDIMLEDQRIRWEMSRLMKKMGTLRTSVYQYATVLSDLEINSLQLQLVGIHNNDGTISNVNLIEAVHYYNVAVTNMIRMNRRDFINEGRILRFILNNNVSVINNTWADISNIILTAQDIKTQEFQQIECYCDLTAILLVVLVMFLIFFPILLQYLRKKAKIFSFFESVEEGILRNMYVDCASKMKDLEILEKSLNLMEFQSLVETVSSKQCYNRSETKTKLHVEALRGIYNQNMLCLSAILIFSIAYFAGGNVWWASRYYSVVDGLNDRMLLSQQRSWYVRSLSEVVIQWNQTTQFFTMELSALEWWENKVREAETMMVYGDGVSIHNDIRSLSGGETVSFSNLCPQLEEGNLLPLSFEACENHLNSILTKGFHEMMLGFLSLSADLRRTYSKMPNNLTYQQEVLIPKMLDLLELADYWIPAASQLFDTWLNGILEDEFSNAVSIRKGFTSLFGVLSVLLVVLVYLPMIREMNSSLQRVRNLLLMIPSSVLDSTKSVRDELRSIVVGIMHGN